MNTYLGASTYLAPPDVDEDLVKAAKVVYLEGYMWDRPAAKAAFQKAGAIARAAGRRVALTLSDSFCVDRFRGEFIDLMRSRTVDTIFANTDEVLSLYETPHFGEALNSLRAEGVLAAVTRSEKGCVVIDGNETWEVPAFPIAELVDTTGAGDLFAAGFLAGLARGRDMVACGRLGGLAAAEIIQHLGARPNVSLAELARQNGHVNSRFLQSNRCDDTCPSCLTSRTRALPVGRQPQDSSSLSPRLEKNTTHVSLFGLGAVPIT